LEPGSRQKGDLASPIRKKRKAETENAVYQFGGFINDNTRVLIAISIYRLGQDFVLKERLEATKGVFQNGRWLVSQGLVKKNLPDGEFLVRRFDREVVELPELPKKTTQTKGTADEMSYRELDVWINRMESEGYDSLPYVSISA
jgi:hypothetical protein